MYHYDENARLNWTPHAQHCEWLGAVSLRNDNRATRPENSQSRPALPHRPRHYVRLGDLFAENSIVHFVARPDMVE